ncbi:MAG: hypothetical protein GXY76_16275 [Chloroflexi bacterium]|nr:hypothetical protein [Chloroflexota bacterium]
MILPDEMFMEGLEEKARSDRHPAAWREVMRWLEERSVQELRQLAQVRGASPHATRKVELVAELVGLLTNRESVERAIAEVSEAELATLQMVYLLATEEGLSRQEVQKALLAWYGPLVAKDATAHLENLRSRALLFGTPDAAGATARFQLPKAVAACLHSLRKPIESLTLSEDSQTRHLPTSLLLEAILALWQYTKESAMRIRGLSMASSGQPQEPGEYSEQPNLNRWLEEQQRGQEIDNDELYVDIPLPAHGLEPADLSELARATGCPPEMIEFICALLLEMGLVTLAADELQVNELAMERYRRHGEVQKLQALTLAWLGTSRWSELRLAAGRMQARLQRHIRAQEVGYRQISQDISHTRQFIARLLSLLDKNRWYSLDSLLEAIGQLCPDLACLAQSQVALLPRWRLAGPEAKPIAHTNAAAWRQSYGQIVAATVEGPLAWLGCVSLAYRDGELVAFQLNGLGQYVLGRFPRALSSGGDMRPLTVAEDLTISVQLGRVDAEIHDFLGQFTDLVEAESDIFRYRISPQQLNQALESGITLQGILSFLERVSGAALPDSAKRKLTEWCDSYGSVRLYEGLTVIEFADDYALRELMNTTSLADHLIYQLSPRMVVIEPDSLEALMSEMVKKGYTPKVEEAP